MRFLFTVFLIYMLVAPARATDVWSCDGRAVSITNRYTKSTSPGYSQNTQLFDVTANTIEKSNNIDSLPNAISSLEELIDEKAQIPNVCNFPQALKTESSKTFLTWIYTVTWPNQDARGIPTMDFPIDVDNEEDLNIKIQRIKLQDYSGNFQVITTLCTYRCR